MTAPLDSVLGAADLVSVLTREVRVRVADISGSGCLMLSDCVLEPGTIGTLRITRDGRLFEDHVRVARVQEVRGSTPVWHIGVEFLWTTAPDAGSLRRMAAGLGGITGPLLAELEIREGRRM